MSRFFAASAFLLGALSACAPTTTQEESQSGLRFAPGRISCLEGTTCDPVWFRSFPYSSEADVADAGNAVVGYDCLDGDWAGTEYVYAFSVQEPGSLNIVLDAGEGLHAFLVARDDAYTCVAEGAAAFEHLDASPGRYWLIVDSKADAERTDFKLEIDFQALDLGRYADEFEPNETEYQAAVIDLGIEESNDWHGTLTPQSRVDWYRFTLQAEGEFYFEVDEPDVEVEAWLNGEPFNIFDNTYRGWSFYYFEGSEQTEDYEIVVKIKAPDDADLSAHIIGYNFEAGLDHTD